MTATFTWIDGTIVVDFISVGRVAGRGVLTVVDNRVGGSR